MRVIAAALLILAGLGAARAQEPPGVITARDGSTRSLESRPTDRAVATFRDVLRAADPGLGEDGRASFALIAEGERDHVAVLAAGVLLVAQVAPEFRPSEALRVQADPGDELAIEQMLLLGPGRPAAVVMHALENRGERLARHLIATPVEGRLQEVYRGPTLYSVETFERGCEPRRLEQRMLPITLREARRDGMAELAMTVREARICVRRGRPRTLNSVMHHARLRWDPAQARYLGGLEALERRNRRMMGGG